MRSSRHFRKRVPLPGRPLRKRLRRTWRSNRIAGRASWRRRGYRSIERQEERMSGSCKIAIVGGGLAGLAAANALRTFGMAPEVFETAPALGEIGAAVNASPQAVKALQAIGVGDKIAAVAYASPGIY